LLATLKAELSDVDSTLVTTFAYELALQSGDATAITAVNGALITQADALRLQAVDEVSANAQTPITTVVPDTMTFGCVPFTLTGATFLDASGNVETVPLVSTTVRRSQAART
jgi:hypothetical protein